MVALIVLSIVLSACGTSTATEVEATPTKRPTREIITVPDEQGPELTSRELMTNLISEDPFAANGALQRMVKSGDQQYVSVLIEVLRARESGLLRQPAHEELVIGLQELSGENLGRRWPDWVEWYGKTDLEPPPGFTDWKGDLLSRIDPEFGEFLDGDAPATIRVEEIVWGGVRVDGIPALDQPEVIQAEEADYVEPGEPVFGLQINDDARAYPLRIMDWHEMANDVIGGVPVLLAYCTLCGAAIAYDGRGPDGNVYTFGSSGFLYRSNKLMYDRQTRSLWNQLTGEPVMGELVGEGLRLDLLPVVLTTWKDWQEQHPDTRVLSLDTGYERLYAPGAAYGHYFSSDETMFPVWQRSQALAAKERIYALQIDGIPKAYPLQELSEETVVNDHVGNTSVVLVMTRGRVTVEGESLRAGPVSYDSGGEVRAFERGDWEFMPGPEAGAILDQAGAEWRVTENALLGPEGNELPRLPGHLAYWFGWYAFFPQTEVYSPP
jgi:hypothetical protein